MQTLYFSPDKLLKHGITRSQATRHHFQILAVEDKIIFVLFLFKNYWYGCKMTVLGRGYLSLHVLESS